MYNADAKTMQNSFIRKQTFIPRICRITTLPETKDEELYKGVRVTEGQRLTKEGVTPSVHASIPGIITQIYLSTHAFGHTVEIIEISLDGRFDFNTEAKQEQDWRAVPIDSHIATIKNLGLAETPSEKAVNTILVGACEKEPGLRHNLALFSEHYEMIVENLMLFLYIFRAKRIFLCLDQKLKHLKKAIERCIQGHKYSSDSVAIKIIPQYQGVAYSNTNLLKEHCKIIGESAQLVSVESMIHMIEAVMYKKPVRKQTVHLHGDALKNDVSVYARIGTPLSQLAEGLLHNDADNVRMVLNGMLTGIEVLNLDHPLDPTIHSIAINKREREKSALPCTSCGACTAICPVQLEPHLLYKLIQRNNKQSLHDLAINRCISCGLCSYICPSRIPLSHWIIQNRQRRTQQKVSGVVPDA